MRKFYLLFTALFAGSVVASAGIKNLYKQDFELAVTAADAGWISPSCADGMSVAGDEYGKYFNFKHSGGGERNAYTLWGTDIYGEGVNKYTLRFDWNPQTKPDTNLANEIVIMADSTFSTNRWQNQNYRKSAEEIKAGATEPLRWWLFDLTELTDEAKEGNTYAVNGDSTNVVTINFNSFYTITLEVDVEARTVEYDIADEFGTPVGAGTYNVPEYVENLRATGLNVLGGKVGSVNQIDNIVIQVETDEDYANVPTVALTGVNGTARQYAVSFEESNDEIVHVTFDGAELTPDEMLDGMYKYNLTTSGKLVAWTESGSAVSEKVEVDVVAEMIALPAVQADIIGVNTGYVKTYKLVVSNAEVPTQPTLFFNYKYTPVTGDVIEKANCQSGEILDVTEKGTLEITTHDGGKDQFQSTTVSYENNVEFAVKDDIDFQHMTEADITGKGFTEIDVLASTSTSGETNWTGRPDALRFTWIKGTNVGDTIQVRPYDVDHGGIRRFVKAPSALTEEVAHSMFAPVYTWFTKTGDGSDMPQAKFNLGIGLIQTGILGDAQDAKITYNNATLGVDDLTENDYIIVNRVDNYGRGKTDYITIEAATEEDAIAKYNAENWAPASGLSVIKGNETFTLYRIDTALARVRTFVSTGESGIQEVGKAVVSDHNAPVYNLNGERVSVLKKGVYVKQGKKFIVK